MASEDRPDSPPSTAAPVPAQCDDGCDMVVARWTRYGKDHLYVSHPDGTRLGYWDLETGESFPIEPEYDELLRCAAESWTSPQETSPQRWPRVVNLFGGVSPPSRRR